ncbi:hypothetical protein MJG53_011678 [Ovis ammon polii x Ovis aries]|uniref:Cystatin domain-containing protein n=2 Tax=Ovis TaxID=9935 RepID=A0A836A3K7_SHEEP|nr:hypothetical protein JEQ12_004279 [Ovis aries]KAI4575475.1 hypothetical protein MJG53_011678 [Ovis ammon polii x Ovis aries]
MTRPWQGPRLLLAVVGALVALSCQSKRRTFILVYEVPVSDPVVVTTMEFLTEDFNKKNEDLYNFRIVRVLKAMKRLTDHLEYQVNLEMRRTTCLKSELTNCSFQEGKLYKISGHPSSSGLCDKRVHPQAPPSMEKSSKSSKLDLLVEKIMKSMKRVIDDYSKLSLVTVRD